MERTNKISICLNANLVERDVFLGVGGFDVAHTIISLQDEILCASVDYCSHYRFLFSSICLDRSELIRVELVSISSQSSVCKTT